MSPESSLRRNDKEETLRRMFQLLLQVTARCIITVANRCLNQSPDAEGQRRIFQSISNSTQLHIQGTYHAVMEGRFVCYSS